MIAERIEQPAARVAQRRLAVLALVEKEAGLLPLPRIDLVAHRAFPDFEALGDLAVEHLDALLEPFEQPDARIVPGQDSRRLHQLHQRRGDLRQAPVDALRERLHDQVIAVLVDDERRQAVRFAMHQPVRRRVELQQVPIRDRRRQAPLDEVRRRRRGAELDEAQRDLGLVAEERVSGRAAALGSHLDEIAGGGIGGQNVAPVNPWMPGARASG